MVSLPRLIVHLEKKKKEQHKPNILISQNAASPFMVLLSETTCGPAAGDNSHCRFVRNVFCLFSTHTAHGDWQRLDGGHHLVTGASYWSNTDSCAPRVRSRSAWTLLEVGILERQLLTTLALLEKNFFWSHHRSAVNPLNLLKESCDSKPGRRWNLAQNLKRENHRLFERVCGPIGIVTLNPCSLPAFGISHLLKKKQQILQPEKPFCQISSVSCSLVAFSLPLIKMLKVKNWWLALWRCVHCIHAMRSYVESDITNSVQFDVPHCDRIVVCLVLYLANAFICRK